MIRPLVIDPVARTVAGEIVAFAQANWYRPGKSEVIPGDDPRHVALVPFGYRCVFSFTYDETERRLFRQLTISLPGNYPSPVAAFMIAELFGFTGLDLKKSFDPPDGWFCTVNTEDRCIVIMQEVDPETLESK